MPGPNGWVILSRTKASDGPRSSEDEELPELPPGAANAPVNWWTSAEELEQNLAALEHTADLRNEAGKAIYADLAADLPSIRWRLPDSTSASSDGCRRPAWRTNRRAIAGL